MDDSISPFCSFRVASWGITLTDAYSDELYGINSLENNGGQLAMTTGPVSSLLGSDNMSALSRFIRRLNVLWLNAVQRCPRVTSSLYGLQSKGQEVLLLNLS